MAESLMAPPPKVDVSTIDAGYGDGFEGFADSHHAGTSSVAGRPVPASPSPHQPDGRPHAQKQPIQPSDQSPSVPATLETDEWATSSEEESPQAVIGNALADARRMAEGSGMLQGADRAAAQTVPPQAVATPPTSSVAPLLSPEVQAGPSANIEVKHDSPFQVSVDQSHASEVPVARQVSQTEEIPSPAPSPASSTPAPAPVPTPQTPQAPLVPNPVGIEEPPFDLPEETVSEPEVGRGPFLTRLQRFSAILRRDLNARSMFLIDSEGQVLLDEVENPKLIQVARTLANASYRATRQSTSSAAVGNLHVKIGANATLEVIPVQSRYGLLILGAIFPAPIGAERVRQVADLLYNTVEPAQK